MEVKEIKLIEDMFKRNIELMKKKNADYAGDNDFFFNFIVSAKAAGVKTEQGMIVRIMDKVTRISNLLHKDPSVVGESIEDTLADLVNYSALLYAFVAMKQAKEEPKPVMSDRLIATGLAILVDRDGIEGKDTTFNVHNEYPFTFTESYSYIDKHTCVVDDKTTARICAICRRPMP